MFFVRRILSTNNKVMHNKVTNIIRSQAVARIADRTA